MPDQTTLRILDANYNRATEALRVIEETARFHLESRALSGDLKSLRHDLRTAVAAVPRADLLAARDAEGDVGADLATPAESDRADADAVTAAAFKRVQEALRAIEEFGKVLSPDLGRAAERLRFRAYTLEKRVAACARPRSRFADARLYVLVTESLCARPWLRTVRAAVAGGADVIQLREKDLPDADYLRRAEQAREVCAEAGALFVVNDRVAVAQLVHADGVHVGQDDLPPDRVRRLVGERMAVGVSTHSLDQARRAVYDGADYLGVGPMFATTTKPHEPAVGPALAREVAAEIAIPWFALGGVTADNLPTLVDAGVSRIAVTAAVVAAPDPAAAARALRAALPEAGPS